MISSPLNSAKDHRSVLENAVTHYFMYSFGNPQAQVPSKRIFGVNTTMTCNSYFACYLALLTLILAIIRASILTGTTLTLVFPMLNIVCSTMLVCFFSFLGVTTERPKSARWHYIAACMPGGRIAGCCNVRRPRPASGGSLDLRSIAQNTSAVTCTGTGTT